MPVLTLKGLRVPGPVIELAVGPSGPRTQELRKQGRPVVYPQVVAALIDTGAHSTMVDDGLIAQLGLEPRGEALIDAPFWSDGPSRTPLYDVQVEWIRPKQKVAAAALPVGRMDLTAFGVRVLLGRDLLARCLLVYNGPDDTYTFSF